MKAYVFPISLVVFQFGFRNPLTATILLDDKEIKSQAKERKERLSQPCLEPLNFTVIVFKRSGNSEKLFTVESYLRKKRIVGDF